MILNTKIKYALTIGAAVGFLAGCASTPEPVKPAEAPKPVEAPKPAPVATPAPAPAPAPAPVATPAPPPAPKPVNLNSKAMFEFNKAVLTSDGKAMLDKEILGRQGDLASVTFVMITGHTDRLGSHAYNQKLSEQRAEAVKSYLTSKGINSEVTDTMGAGKTQPVPGVTCADSLPRAKMIECLAPNRRVAVELKGMPK